MSVTCKNLVPCLISFQQLGRSSVAATFTSCTCPARWSATPLVKGLKLPAIPFVRGPKGAEREAEQSRREKIESRFLRNSFIASGLLGKCHCCSIFTF